MKLRRAFMWAMIVSLTVCGLAGITALLFPRVPFEEEVLGTAATVGLYSMLAMVCAIVIERRRRHLYAVVGGVGIALALLALALVLVIIWGPHWPEETAGKTAFSATFLAINAAHFGLYAPAKVAQAARWLKIGAIVFTTLFCAIMAFLIWPQPSEDFIFRGMGVIGILALVCSTITPIAWKMQALRHTADATPTIRTDIGVNIQCPRCQLQQTLKLGAAKCARCKLDIRIEVEEPRCACGYPFLGLRTDKCPECGRPIPEQDQWAMGQHDSPVAQHDDRMDDPEPSR